MIDFFRLACAILVVSIHLNPMSSINSDLNFWLTQILARIAVPFFFLTSGFFGYLAMQDKTKFKKYIKRIIVLYLMYTLLYLPEIVYNWCKSETTLIEDVLSFIRDFFVTGSYVHLWYFVALVVASSILYFFIHCCKLRDRYIFYIAGVLYCVGVLANSYKNLFLEIQYIGNAIMMYDAFFETTRNGLFFGFFFFTIGYMIRKYNDKIIYSSKYIVLIFISFAIMNLEEYFAKHITGHEGQNMIFTTPFVVVFLFLFLSFLEIDKRHLSKGIFIRKLSVLIFGFHLFVSFYFQTINYKLLNLELNSLEYYLIIISLNIILAVLIILLQKRKMFDFLKFLY